MPIGYLVTAVLAATCVMFALTPLRGPKPLRLASFYVGLLVNELPFLVLYVLLASTLLTLGQGDLGSPVGAASLALVGTTAFGLGVVVWRATWTRHVISRALCDGLGDDWREAVRPRLAVQLRRRPPWSRILFWPFLRRRGSVKRVRNVSYGPAGKRNLLDVYHHRSRPRGGPILVYLHGGSFVRGRKSREALPLLYRLASRGWVCVSANYRLTPVATFPDHLVDVKLAIAWARKHGADYGADPATLFVAGSSAGGHLASMAALTPNDPALQPGFAEEDTGVAGAISLYGYYGDADASAPVPSSPLDELRPDAPPFFIAHGDLDPLVSAADAQDFAERLRSVSANPVVFVTLPGAHHVFDLFHSVRFDAVVDGVEAFAAWVRSRPER